MATIITRMDAHIPWLLYVIAAVLLLVGGMSRGACDPGPIIVTPGVSPYAVAGGHWTGSGCAV